MVSLTVLELGNIFTDGTMPAAAAHPGMGKRRPGQIFFLLSRLRSKKRDIGAAFPVTATAETAAMAAASTSKT